MKNTYKFIQLLVFLSVTLCASLQAQYCIPNYSDGCDEGDGIINFKLGAINQAVPCTDYYHDYTASSTTLVKGVSNTITIRAGYSETGATIWIDYNHNNVFDAATEQIGQIGCVYENQDYSTTFTVPTGALAGNTRLRIMTENEEFPSNPCSTSMEYGNCCDFGINIIAGSTPAVTTLAATWITSSGAKLNGTVNGNYESTAVTFDYGLTVAYGTTIPGTPSPVTGNVNTPVAANITGLSPNTLYHFRVNGTNAEGTTHGSDMTFTTAQYCIPVYNLGCDDGDGMYHFKLNTIDQDIDCSGTPDYYQNLTASVATLDRGGFSTITIQAGGGADATIWIDYNHNNVFDGAEKVGQISCPNSSTSYSLTFMVPPTALTGNTRLRVMTEHNDFPDDPCSTSMDMGNCCDFGVNIVNTPPYCLPVYGYGCEDGDGIFNFKLATINQEIDCNSYYENFTASSATLVKGVSNTVTVWAGYEDTYATIWIDYNHNNVFDAATEQVGEIACLNGAAEYSTTFSVPAGALTGNTRLRIMTDSDDFPDNPCSTTMYYGNCCDFGIYITPSGLPVVTTLAATGIFNTSAILKGTVNAAGQTSNVAFDYGLTVAYGTTVPGTPSPVTGNVDTPVSSAITGLQTNTLYHYRVKCTRTGGTVYGSDMTFTTTGLDLPDVNTLSATGITSSGATLNGTVNANNYSTAVTFQYGLTDAYGTTIPGNPSPVAGNIDTPVTSSITGLSPCTSYHYRCIGESAGGTVYGDDKTFITSFTGTITITGPSDACPGSVGNFYTTESGKSNYIWTVSSGGTIVGSNPTLLSTISVTWKWNSVGPQTVSVNYTSSNGCTASAPAIYNVTVQAPPVPTLSGTASACVGATGQYHTEPGKPSYQWTVSSGGVFNGGNFADLMTVKWNTAGPQTVGVRYTNSYGCPAENFTVYNVTVDSLPVPTITGNATICAGSGGNTYYTEPGKNNYTWTVSPGGTITAGGTSTSNTVTVTWNTAGPQTVSVSYTTPLGCSAASPTVHNVMVHPAIPDPGITGRKIVCRNIPGNVYTTAAGMNNYSWNVSGGGVITDGAGTNSIKVTWDSVGSKNVTVTYIDDNGCSPEDLGEIHVMVIEYVCGCENLK